MLNLLFLQLLCAHLHCVGQEETCHHAPPATAVDAASRRWPGQEVPPRSGNSLQTKPEVLSTIEWRLRPSGKTSPRSYKRRRRADYLVTTVPMLAAIMFAVAAAYAGLLHGVEAVTVPEAPARVDIDVRSGDEVAVAFYAPLSDGGSAVQSYEVSRVADMSPSHSCRGVQNVYPAAGASQNNIPCMALSELEICHPSL